MLYLAVAILALFLLFSVYKNVKFGLTILRMEDVIEECLDEIDTKYENMSEILTRPLFFDSAEVKQVVQDIKDVRESLHKVALALTENLEVDDIILPETNISEKETN